MMKLNFGLLIYMYMLFTIEVSLGENVLNRTSCTIGGEHDIPMQMQYSTWDRNTDEIFHMAYTYRCNIPHGIQVQMQYSTWHTNTDAIFHIAYKYRCNIPLGIQIQMQHSTWCTNAYATLRMTYQCKCNI